MRIETNEEIRELVVGGQSYDVSSLNREAINQLANSLGVQSDAKEDYDPSTQTLELMPKTGSKGALSMRELAEQIDQDQQENDLKYMFEGLDVRELKNEEEEEEDDDDELAGEEEYDPDDEDELDFEELEDEETEETEETEEERQEREYLESFAIPAHHFSKNNIKYFKQNDIDVTDLNELMQAKMRIEEINNDYKQRKVQSLFEQYNNNNEFDVNQLIEEVSKLGHI